MNARIRSTLAVALLSLFGLVAAACGDGSASPLASSATATDTAADVPATATPGNDRSPTAIAPVDTPTPAEAATPRSSPAITPTVAATPGWRPTATEEPDECFRSIGTVYGWYEDAAAYSPADLPRHAEQLRSPCVEDRRMVIWLLGSIHDPAAVDPLEAYIAAHPEGDWVRDEFDLVPVARAAIAYIEAPRTADATYTVRSLGLYYEPRRGDGPVAQQILPAGSRITLLGEVRPGETVEDHGGETEVVFQRIRLPGGTEEYYIDISPYVASYPRYFQKVERP